MKTPPGAEAGRAAERAFVFPSVAREDVPLLSAQTRFFGLAKRGALSLKKPESSKTETVGGRQ